MEKKGSTNRLCSTLCAPDQTVIYQPPAADDRKLLKISTKPWACFPSSCYIGIDIKDRV